MGDWRAWNRSQPPSAPSCYGRCSSWLSLRPRMTRIPNATTGQTTKFVRSRSPILRSEPFTAAERTIVLRALFELAVTASSYDEDPERYDRADHKIRPEQIADLAIGTVHSRRAHHRVTGAVRAGCHCVLV